MTNAELIKGLRWCADESICCDDFSGEKCPYFDEKKDSCSVDEILHDAADALEAAEKRIAIVEEERGLERFAAKNYLDKIDELETQLPKKGEWIEQDDGNSIYHKCSVCGKNQYNVLLEMMQGDYHYCPNCGARMDAGADGERRTDEQQSKG